MFQTTNQTRLVQHLDMLPAATTHRFKTKKNTQSLWPVSSVIFTFPINSTTTESNENISNIEHSFHHIQNIH